MTGPLDPRTGADGVAAPVVACSESPRVSVIIIFLNPGRYLAEAIDSVVAQTLQDWELVLVDDGSSDESTAIAHEWARRRPGQVRYVEHEGHANLGMSASRNRGIREARGGYVAFLDADDVYLPERLATHVAVLDANPAVDMVQCDQIYWYVWRDRRGQLQQEECRRPPLFLGDAIIRPPQGLYMLFGVPDAFNAPCSITIRRATALELGGFEERFRSLYEDQVFLTKVYANRVVYDLRNRLAKYRIHAGGSFVAATASRAQARSDLLEAGRRLRDWQVEYLAVIPIVDDLARCLLADQQRIAHDAGNGCMRVALAGWRRRLRNLLQTLLPDALYRRVLQARQQWSATRAREQYAVLCSSLSESRFRGSEVRATQGAGQ